jgi:hypothetical protein
MLKMNGKNKKVKIEMSQNILTSLFLVAVLVMAGIQTIQLYEFKSDLVEQKATLEDVRENISLNSSAKATAPTSAIPDSLKNIPDMVGGC